MVKDPRCPYCASSDAFMLMSLIGNGRFVCVRCGHIAIPEDKAFQCPCRKCMAMRAYDLTKAQLWRVQKVS